MTSLIELKMALYVWTDEKTFFKLPKKQVKQNKVNTSKLCLLSRNVLENYGFCASHHLLETPANCIFKIFILKKNGQKDILQTYSTAF